MAVFDERFLQLLTFSVAMVRQKANFSELYGKEPFHADLAALEAHCSELLQLSIQKTSGQPRPDGTHDIPFKNFERIVMQICVAACCLVLDDRFPALRDAWESEEAMKEDKK